MEPLRLRRSLWAAVAALFFFTGIAEAQTRIDINRQTRNVLEPDRGGLGVAPAAFTSFPGTCRARKDLIVRTDPATEGQVLYVCNSGGNGWLLVGDGGSGGGSLTVREVDLVPSLIATIVEFNQAVGLVVTDQGGGVARINLINIPDSALATITTPTKVSGAALTLLPNIPAGAGLIPVVNIPNLENLSGVLTPAKGGTGDDTSAITGVPRVSAGNWLYDAGISHLAASTSAHLAGVLSDESGAAGVFPRFNLTSLAVDDGIVWNGTDWVNAIAGLKARADDDGTVALLSTDRGRAVFSGNATANAVSIAQAGTAGFEADYFTYHCVTGAGNSTITPTTSTINGAASLVLPQNSCALIISFGGNYRALVAHQTINTAQLANNSVTLPKIQQIATARILGRTTAATGNVEDLTGTQATALLDVFTSTLKGLAPSSGGGTTNFLRADGTWAAPPGSSSALSAITAATAANTIASGDNAQVWNWSLTTADKSAFTFGESAASTATGNPVLFNIATLAASTAHPFQATARGTANGIRVGAADGVLIALGTGGVNWAALLNYPSGCTNQFVRAVGDTLTCATVAKTDAAGTFVHTDQANTYGAFLQAFQAGANFELRDPTDTTKRLQFALGGLTTATTRTVTPFNGAAVIPEVRACAGTDKVREITAAGVVVCAADEGGTGGGIGTLDLTKFTFREDFVGRVQAGTTNILHCDYNWGMVTISGTNTLQALAGESNAPGIARITTGATANNGATANPTAALGAAVFAANAGWEAKIRVRVPSNADIQMKVGLTNADNFNPGQRVWATFNSSTAANFVFGTQSTGPESTVNSTINAGTGFHVIRFRSTTAGTILFSVDGETEVSLSTQIPTAALFPYIACETLAAAAKQCDIDAFFWEVTVTR